MSLHLAQPLRDGEHVFRFHLLHTAYRAGVVRSAHVLRCRCHSPPSSNPASPMPDGYGLPHVPSDDEEKEDKGRRQGGGCEEQASATAGCGLCDEAGSTPLPETPLVAPQPVLPTPPPVDSPVAGGAGVGHGGEGFGTLVMETHPRPDDYEVKLSLTVHDSMTIADVRAQAAAALKSQGLLPEEASSDCVSAGQEKWVVEKEVLGVSLHKPLS